MSSRLSERLYLRILNLYIVSLLFIISAWLSFAGQEVGVSIAETGFLHFGVLLVLYSLSHVLRMLRLAFLTLEKKERIFPLMMAHALTAFPGALLPVKGGEILRLLSFVAVFRSSPQTALAVWLCERFADVAVISSIILGLFFFRINMPESLHLLFFVFVCLTAVGVLSYFAASRILLFLNRQLVLSSQSQRGLILLRWSSGLRKLEQEINRRLDSRALGLMVLTFTIWALEILALLFFSCHSVFCEQSEKFSELFVQALIGSVVGRWYLQNANPFGTYQALSVIILALLSLLLLLLKGSFSRSEVSSSQVPRKGKSL